MTTRDFQAEMRDGERRWQEAVEASQKLPADLVAGKVFELYVADGKVLYQVTEVRGTMCHVELVWGGPDHYQDAVLDTGGWFPNEPIERLVLRHHGLIELFRRQRSDE